MTPTFNGLKGMSLSTRKNFLSSYYIGLSNVNVKVHCNETSHLHTIFPDVFQTEIKYFYTKPFVLGTDTFNCKLHEIFLVERRLKIRELFISFFP